MTLESHVVVSARGVDAALEVRRGQTLAVLGPNGAGKSTVLAAIAGVLRPDGGRTVLGGEVLHDGAARRWAAPRKRGIALVTQGADLFPAMSVLDNVAFGIRASGVAAREARSQAHGWLERVGLDGEAHRRPDELSGGQARRATLARALAAGPQALLLDEPFSGVDVEAASRLRTLVAHVTHTITTIITTHDALDAHMLADDVVILDHGAVAESGPTANVLARPRTDFAARMAGRFVLRGTAAAGQLILADGTRVPADTSRVRAGTLAAVAVAAGEVTVGLDEGASSGPAGMVKDAVAWLEPRGDVVRVQGQRTAADITPAVAAELTPGRAFWVRLADAPLAYEI